jgi:hypothetical protein
MALIVCAVALSAVALTFMLRSRSSKSPVRFEALALPHLAYPDQRFFVSLPVAPETGDLVIDYRFLDHTGLLVHSGSTKLGANPAFEMQAPKKTGAYTLEYKLRANEAIIECGSYKVAVVGAREPASGAVASSCFGTCVAASDFKHHVPGSSQSDPADFTYANLSGCRWERPIFVWPMIEREEGVYSWDEIDAMVRQRTEAGIGIAPMVAETPRWAAVGGNKRNPPADVAVFRRFMRDLVARYKDSIKYWTIGNEVNAGAPQSGPGAAGAAARKGWAAESYVAALKAAYEGAKEADPAAQILICGVAMMDLDWIDQVYRAGGKEHFDIMNIHPYCFPAPPESTQGGHLLSMTAADSTYNRFGELKALMAQYGDGGKPIWITEVSWSDGLDHINETDDRHRPFMVTARQQAQYIVRAHVLAFAWGIEKVFLLSLPDVPAGVQMGPFDEFHGLISRNLEPKLSYVAYANMTAQLEGARFEKALSMPRSSQYGYVFDRQGKKVTVLWDTEAASFASLLVGEPSVEVVDMCGNAQRRGAADGVAQLLVISPDPTFVVGGKQIEAVKPSLPSR